MTQAPAVWIPAADQELSWFGPAGAFPETPGPLAYTLEAYARAFGLTRALSSLNFPFYELHTRLAEGRLQLGVVPSGLAERDMDAQFQRLADASVRFTKDIRRPWETATRSHAVREEVVSYNEEMSGALPAGGEAADLADGLRRLQRIRGTQWYAAARAVFGPVAVLQRRIDDLGGRDAAEAERLGALIADARGVIDDAADLLAEGGRAAEAAVGRAGAKLAELGSLEAADDVGWLELEEVREALRGATRMQAVVEARRAAPAPSADGGAAPEPPDAPELYLIPEVLALIAGTSAAS